LKNATRSSGLSKEEVLSREKQGLVNTVPEKITKSTWEILKDNIFTLFNAFNLMIAVFLATAGAWLNMAYLAVIIINILIGIYEELHAKKLVENLSLINIPEVFVIRNGEKIKIPPEKIVLDDLMVLDSGCQICSDSEVINGEIEVNESLLTGESDPVIKRPGDTLLSGSFVVSGKAFAQVACVGTENFAAKLAHGAKKHKKINSELLKSMRKVTRFTSFFIIPVGILLFLQTHFWASDKLPYNAAAVSTSAALLGMLPKGLVLLISISLAAGIIKLSKKRILVQQLHSLEALAHVDILCLDKTGTITEGKMSVSDFYVINHKLIPIPAGKAIGCFVNASDDNNSTFIALKEYFPVNDTYKPVEKIPFSSQRKWSSVSFENFGSVVIGAPEKLLNNNFSRLPEEAIAAQASGARILCAAFTGERITSDTLPQVSLIGVIVLRDTIRKNAKKTLDFFKKEGVGIKIISGDNPITVSNIAKTAGFDDYDSYIDFSKITSDEEIAGAAKKYSIFARVTPNQKSLLIKTLQSEGHTVAMTGDGVNDVLALKEADCGIAMASGNDAAKQVSQLVLLDSDFSSLPDAVMEGRRVINNITNIGGIFFIKTVYSVLLSILCIILGIPFPFLPIQITFIDLIIEGYPSFFLSLEPSREKIKGTFLNSAIKRAAPFALMILLSNIAVMYLFPVLPVNFRISDKSQLLAIMFCITGFISILAVFKACRPFNKLRIFLSATVAIGFFAAIYLFRNMLEIQMLTAVSLLLLVDLAAVCVPLIVGFDYIINKLLSVSR